jgi:threonine/homoserine/homoserine lactone efflux protein
VHSLPAFLAVAAAVTLAPGPAFGLLLHVSVVHGRRAAFANIAGNSLGVVVWGALAAVGVSALVAANQLAYDVLRAAGAAFLVWLGVRALWAARHAPDAAAGRRPLLSGRGRASAWQAGRRGFVNSVANPTLVALGGVRRFRAGENHAVTPDCGRSLLVGDHGYFPISGPVRKFGQIH